MPIRSSSALAAPEHAAPAFMFDFLSAWGFRAVCVAFRAGIPAVLEQGPRTAGEVAAEVGFDPEGTAFLLEVLGCLGYLTESGGRYANTPVTTRLIPLLADGVPYFEKLAFKDWETLESRLRGDTELPFAPDEPRTPHWLAKQWRVFQDGMVALANMNIDEVLHHVELPEAAGHLLDLGGGHGLYSVAFCRRYPGLEATVYEIPEMEPIVNRTIAEHGMAGRVHFRAGDFFVDDLGPSSATLLFNVIHSKSPAQNRKLLERVANSLEPGGTVVLLDQFPSPRLGRLGHAFGAMMALSMFNLLGQRTYQLDEVRDWFSAAGLVRTRVVPIRSVPGNALVIGRKRAA
jgi:3-hydroxy-5-methyl-1-naphthoate 3-O-methyltransferase